LKLSKRVQSIGESITLKLNAKAGEMKKAGQKVYNLTAGQLPFRPLPTFINLLRSESDFIHSFQYSPVAGLPKLREKMMEHVGSTRDVTLPRDEMSCVISNGGKHAISNIFSCLIDEGDEVVLIAPYWVSYPEMISLYGGRSVIVSTNPFDVFVPSISDIKNSITDKTKLIVINSPNNPSGTHYSDEWMKEFAELMLEYPDLLILSDEIYYHLYYFDPKPTYFYQHKSELIKRTIIVDGISKTLASTGLRIGYAIGPKILMDAINKLQGQTSSGANSLVQHALAHFDLGHLEHFLVPIKKHLQGNSEILGEALRRHNLGHIWYQPQSAFYYLMDFSQAPVKDRFKEEDASVAICEELLDKHGVALVPGAAFGMKNCARLSLVSDKVEFMEAAEIIVKFMTDTL
jgi:aspartate aminotransferase